MRLPAAFLIWILALALPLLSRGAEPPKDAIAAFAFDGSFSDSVAGNTGLLEDNSVFTKDRQGNAGLAAQFPQTGMMASTSRSYIKNKLQWSWVSWVRSDIGHNGDVGTLYSEGNSGISGHISISKTNIMVALWNENVGWSYIVSTVPVTLGVWQHVGVVFSATTNSDIGKTEIYLDGRLVTTGALPYLKASGWRAERREFAFGANIGYYSGGQPRYSFSGALDDARLFDRALSSEEVLAISGLGSALLAVPALELIFPTSIGQTYQLQFSDDLNDWTNYGETFPGTGGETSRFVSTRTTKKQFWRLLGQSAP